MYIVYITQEYYTRVNNKYKYENCTDTIEEVTFNNVDDAIEFMDNYELDYSINLGSAYFDYLYLQRIDDCEDIYNRGFLQEEMEAILNSEIVHW